jgi:hypothetical protein
MLRPDREAVYARTARRFERATFFSPDPDSTPGELRWMSPLIVEELDSLRSEDSPLAEFGRLSVETPGEAVKKWDWLRAETARTLENQRSRRCLSQFSHSLGEVTVNSDEPTVYHTEETVAIDETNHAQSTYLWFYPSPEPGGKAGWRGFRMILDQRGFAIVWQVLSSEAGLRVLYVSKPIEDAARRQYGDPLPDRRFVVEPDVAEHPDVVVARIVGDGPQPMGPFVYLDYPARRVSTLICRCEPSQVDLFPQSRMYRLVALEQVDSAVRQVIDRALAHDRSGSLRLLRWPSDW